MRQIRAIVGRLWILLLMALSMLVGLLLPSLTSQVRLGQAEQTPIEPLAASFTPTETIPPSTPLATLTPSHTLRPPPTFEPPTATVAPSASPTATATQGVRLDMQIPGIQGLETATPSSTPGCTPRADWKQIYEVQFNDALDRIAAQYNMTSAELAQGNCLADPNLIVVGQKLRIPGGAQLSEPSVACVDWEVLTPINGAYQVDGYGTLTFNWRGPAAPRNLIRVINPNGQIWERVVDLRQNESVNIAVEPLLLAEGTYTWYVFPLDMNFVQIQCKEGGPWSFHKTQGPTPTPTLDNPLGP